jgi:hypothetical protein
VGATGPAGPSGPPGVSGYVVISAAITVSSLDVVSAAIDVICTNGRKVVGGGVLINVPSGIAIFESRPQLTGGSYRVGLARTGPVSSTAWGTGYAVCVNAAP